MQRSFDSLSIPAAKEMLFAVLAGGNRFRFTVHGVSMSPFIREGDTVELSPVGKLHKGRIYLAEKKGRLLLHRAVAVKGNRVLLKGDNLPEPDGWFEKEGLLAVTVAVVHRQKRQKWGIERLPKTVAELSRRNFLRKAVSFAAKFLKK